MVLVALLLQARALRRLRRRVDLLPPVTGRAADGLDGYVGRIEELARAVAGLEGRSSRLERSLRAALQRVGLVRFNPFEDTGGNQSFSLAILDEDGDGVVISSLHARTSTRIYAKAIVAGRADGPLSDEEQEALRRATGRSG